MNNKNLIQSRINKNDEYYTQYKDIQLELNHYIPFFENKIIYCNCDDPSFSQFFQYFINNFSNFKLKQLITSHLNGYITITDYSGTKIIKLTGNGSFDSPECINLLKQSDIIITNPPFSIFSHFISTLYQYHKDFIIIGGKTSIPGPFMIDKFKNNEIQLGYNYGKGSMNYITPDNNIKSVGSYWFTNLSIPKHTSIPLFQKYSPDLFPHYDNICAIEVNKTKNIPLDYDGIMGVPISFILYYNPSQFQILTSTARHNFEEYRIKNYTELDAKNYNDLNAAPVIIVDGKYKPLYSRLLIKKR